MIRKLVLMVVMLMSAMVASCQSFVWFKEPDEIFRENLFKVKQIWTDKYALAVGKGDAKRSSKDFNGEFVLLVAADGSTFYDNQIIELKRDKIPLVIGVFKFMSGKKKNTIPVIAIKKKEKRTVARTRFTQKNKANHQTTEGGLIAD